MTNSISPIEPNFDHASPAPAGPSNRSFAAVMAIFFFLVALAPIRNGMAPRLWAGILASTLVIVAIFFPKIVGWPNRLWMRLALLLNRFTLPILMGILFFVIVTPLGLLMRLLGKDPLRLKMDKSAATYWRARPPDTADSDNMKWQF